MTGSQPRAIPLTEPVQAFRQLRYRCPYCRRSWSSLKRANEHRDGCWRRPGGCKTCEHAETLTGDYAIGCELGLGGQDDTGGWQPIANCPLWERAGAAP